MQLSVELLCRKASRGATSAPGCRANPHADQLLHEPGLALCKRSAKLCSTRAQRALQGTATAESCDQRPRDGMQQGLATSSVLPQIMLGLS